MASLSAISITFLRVDAPVNPPPKFALRSATSVSIVGVFGESITCNAGVAEESTGATFVTIASTFAA
ncbi:unannotated protein [freshwater metagenome]|uniref:Unannotated protein n=1 Tax=freshwater metagenome TaxID=449393 RepID=A0A6J6EIX7_9ZZZZ